jgi:hypothetical protein
MAPDFESFESIPRLSRECYITEKIDGTNAQVCVLDTGEVLAGSRSRWITPADDNFGFARWVAEHEEELRTGLGVGRHYGEWWGAGIQRRYGLSEKRFSLFNSNRWADDAADRQGKDPRVPPPPPRPECCHVVPVLWKGVFDSQIVDFMLKKLETEGSAAAPGFMKPEGVVVWHVGARKLFKKTIEGDGHKGAK